jgi:hypothetical protein
VVESDTRRLSVRDSVADAIRAYRGFPHERARPSEPGDLHVKGSGRIATRTQLMKISIGSSRRTSLNEAALLSRRAPMTVTAEATPCGSSVSEGGAAFSSSQCPS